ncbi:MAG: 2Fe-2S iron-sulfur cluster-binding protein [Aggregatilineales bacterium]
MATITLKNGDSFDAKDDKRLVLAIRDHGVDILHRCGGFAKCTTCRVKFVEGEPDKMTEAEHTRLTESELMGEIRLSCQILCDHPMTVEPLMTQTSENRSTPGNRPQDHITPPPVWRDAVNE